MNSNKSHLLNSFIPNLVWLPTQFSKLTDRDHSYAQAVLQSISYNIYRRIKVPKPIEKLWDLMPLSSKYNKEKVNAAGLNYFDVSGFWIDRRIDSLSKEIDMILSVNLPGDNKRAKVKSRRYLPTLRKLSAEKRRPINEWLREYRKSFLSVEE